MSKYGHYGLIIEKLIFIHILILFIFKNHRLMVSLSLLKYLTAINLYFLELNSNQIKPNFEKKNYC